MTLWDTFSDVVVKVINLIIKYIGPILFTLSIIFYILLYLNAFSNHQLLYNSMSNTPKTDITDPAWTYYNLMPSQCSPSNIVMAAQYPCLSSYLGFINPYTALYADMACRGAFPDATGNDGGVTFQNLCEFIYRSETTPNIILDSINPVGLFQSVFKFNPVEAYSVKNAAVDIKPPKPPSMALPILNTVMGVVGTLMMFK